MTVVAWFNPFCGIAGDMALGALIDAGADAAAVEATCRSLAVGGWRLGVESVLRGGLRGVHVAVDTPKEDHHRRAGDILDLIGSSGLPERVAERAGAVFERLANVEGRLHGIAPADVTFHEVGAVDSIVDIVGVCAALELLAVEEVSSAPVAQGVGTVRAAHGVLPNPAPAVLALLAGVPVQGVDVGLELTTPTGAALLAALGRRFGPMPSMVVRSVGYGAGSRDLPERPNLLQVVVGEAVPGPGRPGPGGSAGAGSEAQHVTLLETTLDDVTGETLGHTVSEALAAGALDAWLAPVTMKKGRPGHVLSVLVWPHDVERLRQLVAAHTGTLGIRALDVQRWVAPRSGAEVDYEGHRIAVKVGPHRAKAEHDDVAAAARATGHPVWQVAASAEAAFRARAAAEAAYRASAATEVDYPVAPPDAAVDAAGVASPAEDSLRHNER